MKTAELIQIDQIEVNTLPELNGFKEKMEALVVENPFIEVIDHKTYEEGKKRRTALVSGRTAIQSQEKLIASKIRDFRNKVSGASKELIEITIHHEEKQQSEVKRYEEIKATEKAEKERIEEERKQKIRDSINSIFTYWSEVIKECTFQSFTKDTQLFYDKVETSETEKFEEFELDFSEKVQLLKNLFSEKKEQLKYAENQRLEDERLIKERAQFEKDQAKAKEKEAIASKKREEAQAKIDAKNKEKADELKEQQDKIDAENSRIDKEKQDALDKKEAEQKLETEKNEKALKIKRIKALKPDVEKLTSLIQSIKISEVGEPQFKNEISKKFLINIELQLSELKENLLAELGTLK